MGRGGGGHVGVGVGMSSRDDEGWSAEEGWSYSPPMRSARQKQSRSRTTFVDPARVAADLREIFDELHRLKRRVEELERGR